MRAKTSRKGSKDESARPTGWRSGARRWWWAGLAVAAAVAVVAVWLSAHPGGETSLGSGDLPGPLGGPSVAQDVDTLLGKPAPAFTLADSDGRSYTVTPGRGRPLVVVFHMGVT